MIGVFIFFIALQLQLLRCINPKTIQKSYVILWPKNFFHKINEFLWFQINFRLKDSWVCEKSFDKKYFHVWLNWWIQFLDVWCCINRIRNAKSTGCSICLKFHFSCNTGLQNISFNASCLTDCKYYIHISLFTRCNKTNLWEKSDWKNYMNNFWNISNNENYITILKGI